MCVMGLQRFIGQKLLKSHVKPWQRRDRERLPVRLKDPPVTLTGAGQPAMHGVTQEAQKEKKSLYVFKTQHIDREQKNTLVRTREVMRMRCPASACVKGVRSQGKSLLSPGGAGVGRVVKDGGVMGGKKCTK